MNPRDNGTYSFSNKNYRLPGPQEPTIPNDLYGDAINTAKTIANGGDASATRWRECDADGKDL